MLYLTVENECRVEKGVDARNICFVVPHLGLTKKSIYTMLNSSQVRNNPRECRRESYVRVPCKNGTYSQASGGQYRTGSWQYFGNTVSWISKAFSDMSLLVPRNDRWTQSRQYEHIPRYSELDIVFAPGSKYSPSRLAKLEESSDALYFQGPTTNCQNT